MKNFIKIGLVLGFVSTSLLANGADLYKRCVNCHGPDGGVVALGKSKVIKNMSKQEFIDSLKGYQNGTYGGTMKGLMTGQVKTLSDADITAIANHIVK